MPLPRNPTQEAVRGILQDALRSGELNPAELDTLTDQEMDEYNIGFLRPGSRPFRPIQRSCNDMDDEEIQINNSRLMNLWKGTPAGRRTPEENEKLLSESDKELKTMEEAIKYVRAKDHLVNQLTGAELVGVVDPPTFTALQAMAGQLVVAATSGSRIDMSDEELKRMKANLAYAKDLYRRVDRLKLTTEVDLRFTNARIDSMNEQVLKEVDRAHIQAPLADLKVDEREKAFAERKFDRFPTGWGYQHARRTENQISNHPIPMKRFSHVTADVDNDTKIRKPIGEGLDIFSGLGITKFSYVEEITSYIKPLTFMSMIAQLIEAKTHIRRLQIVLATLEAYNLYWQSASLSVHFIATCVLDGVEKLSEIIADKQLEKLKPTTDETELKHEAGESDDLMEQFFGKIGEVLPDGAKKIGPIVKLIGPLLFVGCTSLGVTAPGAKVAKVVNIMAQSCKNTHAIFGSMDDVQKGLTRALTMTFDADKLHTKDAFIEQMRDAMKIIEEFDERLKTEQIRAIMTSEGWDKVRGAYDEASELYDAFIDAKENSPPISTLYIQLQKAFADLKKEYDRMKNMNNIRQEPAVLWLYGEPGVGKSQFAKYIVHLLQRIEKRKLTVYSRNPTDQYHSNYKGQDVVIYDDFGAATDGVDIAEFVTMKSSNALQLNMAALEEKGTKFTSRYIIICSNQPGILSTDILTTPKCIDRRRDVLLFVQDDYAVGFHNQGIMVPTDHYQADFSHLTLTRFNPLLSNGAGNYTILRGNSNPTYTPTRLAYELKRYEQQFKATFEHEITRKEEEDDSDTNSLDEEVEEEFDEQDLNRMAEHFARMRIHEPKNVSRRPPPRPPQPPPPPRQREAWEGRDFQRTMYFGRQNQDARLTRAEVLAHVQEDDGMALQAGYKTYSRSFCIVGAPGLGKTALLTDLKANGCVWPTFDEFTVADKRDEAMAAVWRAYEEDVDPVVLTCNDSTLTKDMFKAANREPDAFYRRCYVIKAQLKALSKWKQWGGKAIDFDNDIEYVCTHYADTKEKIVKKLRRLELINLIKTPQTGNETDVTTSTKLPIWERALPTDVIRINTTVAGFPGMGLSTLFKDYVSGKLVDLTTFNGNEKLKLMKSLRCFSDLLGGVLPDCMVMANNKKVKTDLKYNILFHLQDANYVLSSETGVNMFYEIEDTDAVVLHVAKQTTARRVERSRDMTGRQLILEIVDAVFYVLKLGVGIGVSVHTFVDIASRKEKKCSGMCNEGWGEEMDEISPLDYSQVTVPKRVAKSMRSTTRIRDYCKTCHSTECSHCYSLEVESITEQHPMSAADKRFWRMAECMECGPVLFDKRMGVIKRDGQEYEWKYGEDINAWRKKEPISDMDAWIDKNMIGESNEEHNITQKRKAQRIGSFRPDLAKEALEEERKSGAARRAARNQKEIPRDEYSTQSSMVYRAEPIQAISGSIMSTHVVDSTKYSMPRIPIHVPDLAMNQSMTYEAMSDMGARTVSDLCQGNTVYVGNPEKLICRALMVKNNFGVTVCHGLGTLKQGAEFNIFTKDRAAYRARILVFNSKRDIVVFEVIDKSFPMYKDILKHIARREDSKAREGCNGWLVICYPNGTKQINNIILADCKEMMVAGEMKFGQKYRGHATGLQYDNLNTQSGDCGSAVILLDPTKPRKILALHAAANQRVGLGSMIYADELQETIDTLYPQCKNEEKIHILDHQQIIPITPMSHGEYKIIGVAGDPKTGIINHQFQNTKTRYWDSPLSITKGVFEPVVLSDQDPRPTVDFRPYEDGVEKFNHPQAEMDEPLLNKAVDEIGEYLASVIFNAGVHVRVLTKTEAINGISWISSSNPIQRDTSAGYPWKHIAGADAKKSAFLEYEPRMDLWVLKQTDEGKMMNHAVDRIIQHARRREMTAVVNCATLKDEPRKIKRIYQVPATRAFWGAPLDKVLADRMYFHAAIAALSETHESHPIKIGMNPMGIGFDILYNWHSKISTLGFDMDASNFDSTVPRTVMEKVARVWNRIYQVNDRNWKQEDDVVRETLHEYVVKPLVLYRDFVVQLPGGNPSGQPMTGTDNSIIHFVYDYYIWLRLCVIYNRRNWMTLGFFLQKVASSFFGDDGMITVAADARDMYNPRNYIAEASDFGLVCTPADKSSVQQANFKPLEQLEFLKRNFVKSVLPNGETTRFWCGALQLDSFSKMLDMVQTNKPHDYWKDVGEVRFDICTIVGTIEVALIEAVNHGHEYFNKIKRHLMKCCRDYNIEYTKWPSYAECFSILWGCDLSDDFHTIYSKGDELQPESMSAPAVVGDGDSSMHSHGTGAAAPTSMAPEERATEKLSGFIKSGTGAPGSLPGLLYDKDIAVGTVAWSSTQNAGTIVYEQPISPRGANEYVKYFAAPFYAWCGGFVWTIVIAGTGFNGGKLAICRMPPGYDPKKAHTLQDLSVFPFDILDVKQAEAISKAGVDEKNVLFHWRDEESDTIHTKDATGGTFVIYVLSPLINSTGGVAQVNIVIFNRPDESFRVSQLMPLPSIDDSKYSLAAFSDFFPLEPHTVNSPYDDQPIDEMVVYSATGTPVLTKGMYGQVQGNGEPFGRKYTKWNYNPIVVRDNQTRIEKWGDATSEINRPLKLKTAPLSVGSAVPPQIYAAGIAQNQFDDIEVGPDDRLHQGDDLDMNDGNYIWDEMKFHVPAMATPGIACPAPGTLAAEVTVDTDGKTIAAPLEESFVVFRRVVNAFGRPPTVIDSTQTSAVVEALSSGAAKKVLQPGQAVLFTVIDKQTDLPIAYLKFSYPGYFTTTPSATVVVGDYWANLYIPTQFVDMTTIIPKNAEMLTNSFLINTMRRPRIQRGIDTGRIDIEDVTNRVLRVLRERKAAIQREEGTAVHH